MLDTLKLKLAIDPTRDVVADASWQVPPPKENGAGDVVEKAFPIRRKGKASTPTGGAYFNDPRSGLRLDARPDGVWVELSLPRYVHGDNFEAVGSREEVEGAISRLGSDLRSWGVRCDLREASISRLDTFRHAINDFPFAAYSPLFDCLSLPRTQERDYGSTRLYSNRRQQLCIYDKISELKHKKQSVEGLPDNVMRFEQRLRKPEKVRATLGFNTVADLLADYGALPRAFNDTMRSIFRYDPPQIERMAADDLARRLEYFKAKGKYFTAASLEAFGVAYLLERMDIETIAAVYGKAAGKMQKSRVKQKLKEHQFNLCASGISQSAPVSMARLYSDLRAKVIIEEPLLRLVA